MLAVYSIYCHYYARLCVVMLLSSIDVLFYTVHWIYTTTSNTTVITIVTIVIDDVVVVTDNQLSSFCVATFCTFFSTIIIGFIIHTVSEIHATATIVLIVSICALVYAIILLSILIFVLSLVPASCQLVCQNVFPWCIYALF